MLRPAENWLEGVHVTLPTPFALDGALDVDAFGALCLDVLATAPASIVIGTPLGERSVLDLAERTTLAATATAIAREARRHTVAGSDAGSDRGSDRDGPMILVDVSTTDWRRSGLLAADAAEVGADAVLLSAPTDHRPSARELVDHVRSVAGRGLPILLVNDPATTRMTLGATEVLGLAHEEGVVGVVDAADEQDLLADLHHRGTSLHLLIGRDEHVLAGRDAGASGWLSAVGCLFPRLASDLWPALHRDGVADAAGSLLTALEPLLRLMSGPRSVSSTKLLLDLLGRTGGGPPRPPRRAVEGTDREVLAQELRLLQQRSPAAR